MEPVRVELEDGFTAQADYQENHTPPFWVFGFMRPGSGQLYQPTLLFGSDPHELIQQGIELYGLPPAKENAS